MPLARREPWSLEEWHVTTSSTTSHTDMAAQEVDGGAAPTHRATRSVDSMRGSDSSRLLSEVAPHLLTPSMINALAKVSLQAGQVSATRDPYPLQRATLLLAPRFSLENPARSLARISTSLLQFSGWGKTRPSARTQPVTSMDIGVLEESQRILAHASEDLDGSFDTGALDEVSDDVPVSLLRGYEATVPGANAGKARRRHIRAQRARGDNSASNARTRRRTERSEQRLLSLDELEAQDAEVAGEMRHLDTRRALYHAEIVNVEAKIAALEATKAGLQQKLLAVREEELELEDERALRETRRADTEHGLAELLELQRHRRAMPGGRGLDASTVLPATHRWKGPVFLPSEHDELPAEVAFMTLEPHVGPTTALDFSEPYGTLVSAAIEDAVRVWDLSTGEDVGRLRGHTDTVSCLQVVDETCITGSQDSTARVFDLRRVDDFEAAARTRMNGGEVSDVPDPCLRTLEGHSCGISALCFDSGSVVTGANDKTMRQWDLETGQCVLTMDILWALSSADHGAPTKYNGPFSYPMPPFEDGSWEMFTDFVGGVQFWGYALASGSGDGGVRMWDCA